MIALRGRIRTLALLGVILVFMVGALELRAADPRVGAWALVSAQSTMEPANKLSITSKLKLVHVVMSGETRLDFTAKADGKPMAVEGNPAFDQVEMRKIDGKQAQLTEKKNGAVVATVLQKVSKDGKELTITRSSKGHADQTTVWTRTGGAKAVLDPVAGDWTEDLSKTRLAQGLPLKIEADGGGGVRFLWDFSYTARLDGRPYEVRNSRNDTVTLQLVDARTVDAFYKREDLVTQKDRWVVSGDGREMTVTTSGTLESGQRVAETLVFKRL